MKGSRIYSEAYCESSVGHCSTVMLYCLMKTNCKFFGQIKVMTFSQWLQRVILQLKLQNENMYSCIMKQSGAMKALFCSSAAPQLNKYLFVYQM